jgi:hypothetical protein
MSKEGFQKFPERTGLLGYPGANTPHLDGAQWILELDDAKRLIDKSKGNAELIWHDLGLPNNKTGFDDTLLCVINPIALWNLREATRDTPGANENFLGTGFTPGGQREMVISQLPLTMAMVASDGDFWVQKYVSTVPLDDAQSMTQAIEIAQLAQQQVTSFDLE